MGRAGSGSGGSSHSSSGHSVGSRSGGGHRVSSGSSSSSGTRARGRVSTQRSGGNYGFSGVNSGFFRGGHIRMPSRGYRGYMGGSGGSGGVVPLRLSVLVTGLIILVMLVLVLIGVNGRTAKSTINREKLEGSAAFINDCIVDELGWFSNTKKASKSLQSFYEKTGVQPYIVLRRYDATLRSDSDKDAWATQYYDSNIKNENTFLYVYFAEANEDTDVGYMCYVNGTKVSSVMDAEAVDIFWGYIDRYWYSDMTTDALFAKVFDKTGSTIMRVSKTGADIVVAVIVGAVVIGVFAFLYLGYKKKIERDRQRAEETERILNSSMQDLVDGVQADDITNRYD